MPVARPPRLAMIRRNRPRRHGRVRCPNERPRRSALPRIMGPPSKAQGAPETHRTRLTTAPVEDLHAAPHAKQATRYGHGESRELERRNTSRHAHERPRRRARAPRQTATPSSRARTTAIHILALTLLRLVQSRTRHAHLRATHPATEYWSLPPVNTNAVLRTPGSPGAQPEATPSSPEKGDDHAR